MSHKFKEMGWAVTTLIIVFVIVNLLPEPNMISCGFAGQCLGKYYFWDGFVWIFLSSLLGPKRLWFFITLLLLCIARGVLPLARTGEIYTYGFYEFITVLPYSPFLRGASLGAIVAVIGVIVVRGFVRNAG